jgi:mono/diheme cytochrome c family protein
MKVKKAIMIFSLLLFAACLMAQTVHKTKTGLKSHGQGLAASLVNGKKVYTLQCVSCHQADAAGVPHMNPPLIKTTYVLGDKTTLIKIVLNGFKEDVEINGETFSNNMPPHDAMKDKEIADVLTYVRKNFGNKASAVTAAHVKMVRAANKK